MKTLGQIFLIVLIARVVALFTGPMFGISTPMPPSTWQLGSPQPCPEYEWTDDYQGI